jgi:hypothetical protein
VRKGGEGMERVAVCCPQGRHGTDNDEARLELWERAAMGVWRDNRWSLARLSAYAVLW